MVLASVLRSCTTDNRQCLVPAPAARRVLKPGGLLVLTDSVQLGDRPEWDKTLGAFGNFNEPHYRCAAGVSVCC